MSSETTLTRRQLLGGATAVGACIIVGGVTAVAAGTASAETGGSLAGVQYGFLVNMNKCVDCEKCVAACREFNHLSEDTPNRRTINTFVNSRGESVYVSTSCMHCGEPACERVCPAGAITKGEAGIVATNKDVCIGCKYCFEACPYGVPNYNSVAMDKCDCCLDAGVAPGEKPYCVRACKFGALEYGPLDDLYALAEKQGKTAVPVGEAGVPSCLLIGEV